MSSSVFHVTFGGKADVWGVGQLPLPQGITAPGIYMLCDLATMNTFIRQKMTERLKRKKRKIQHNYWLKNDCIHHFRKHAFCPPRKLYNFRSTLGLHMQLL